MPTTVDKIRRALEKRGGIAEEEMQPLADDYRAQVNEVNSRLDEAVMLLRKGLRSEAIQRVEMTPNALDAAAELEFPEWDEWNEILQFMGIPLPPKLNEDYVAQINEAIIESLPLDALLRRHRRLAIAKAPLSIRLRTLRQIARVDAANSVWQDDVEAWEKIRLNQIDNELKSALEREDSQSLYNLHKELTGGTWRITPASRLIEQSKFAAESFVRDNQESELKQLVGPIVEAFEGRDENAARNLRKKWQSTRAKFSATVSPALEQQVQPALQWLEDLDRQAVIESERQLAIAHLESTLESSSSIEQVQQAYDQASQFGQPVPEELSQRVTQLRSAPAKKAQKKMILIGAGIAAVLLAAAAGIGIYMMSSGKENKLRQTVDQMESFVAAEQYDEAIEFYTTLQSLQPEVAANPQMVALFTKARKTIDGERARKQLFDKKFAAANNDDPALIDELLLPQLEELASTETEKAQVRQLRKLRDEHDAGEAMRQSDELIAKVGELRRSFTELAGRGSSDANRQAIQDVLNSVSRLPNQYPRGNRDALAKQETLRSQIKSTLDRMKSRNMETEQRVAAIDELLASRSLEQYSDRLREVATRSVASTGFVDFRAVIKEEEQWLDVERTNQWLDSFGKKLENGVTSTEAITLRDSADSLRRSVSPNPVFNRIRDFDQTMAEIVKRRSILQGAFARISKHPLTRLVTLPISESSGTTNYLVHKTFVEQNSDRMSRQGSIGVSVVSDALGGVRNRAFQGPLPKTIDEPMKSVLDVVSRQKKQAIEFDGAWERTFLLLVRDVISNPNLDGVVKEWLVFELLTAATDGSKRLDQLVPQSMRALQRRSSVRNSWYQPRKKDNELNRELASQIFRELNIAFKRLSTPLEPYEKAAENKLRWIGFLAKSSNGQVEYHLRGKTPESDGELYVAASSDEADVRTAIVKVGSLDQGHVTLTSNPVHLLPGRPLFLLPN